jgi:hypothetical protein
MMDKPLSLGAAALALATLAGCATMPADSDLPPPSPAIAGCDPAIAMRLSYLEPRLASHAEYANRWWWIWNSVHAIGLVYGGVNAGIEDDGGERAQGAVDATKSAIGLARGVLDPPALRDGYGLVEDVDTGTPQGCLQRLHAAEELLYTAAEQAHEERRGWTRHVGNLGLNTAGAAIVAEGFDEPSGWGSGALGFVVGEIEIWTYPWHAERTARDYEARFPRDHLSAPRWRVEERGGDTVMVLD